MGDVGRLQLGRITLTEDGDPRSGVSAAEHLDIPGGTSPTAPAALAWSGRDFVVVYAARPVAGPEVFAVRIGADDAVVSDPVRLDPDGEAADAPSLAAVAEDDFVVTWERGGQVLLLRGPLGCNPPAPE